MRRLLTLLGSGCMLLLGSGAAAAATKPEPLQLDCQINGGGYALTDSDGRVLENGDGAPFAPPPRATLLITRDPARVRVTAGTLPHPTCASGPSLDGTAPIRFHWCDATYDVTADGGRQYSIRSTSHTLIVAGEHAGSTMQVFITGRCVSPARSNRK